VSLPLHRQALCRCRPGWRGGTAGPAQAGHAQVAQSRHYHPLQ
jgi:hypothetical protein